MAVRTFSLIALALLAAATPSLLAQEERLLILYDFEATSGGWRLLAEGELGPLPCRVAEGAAGGRSLCVPVRFPGVQGAGVPLRSSEGQWHPFTHLMLAVYVPPDAPSSSQVIVYLKEEDAYYYQHLRRAYLPVGRWTELKLDITATSRDWQPSGHFRPWDGYCRSHVLELGVKFICQEAFEGEFMVDNVRLGRDPDCLPIHNAIYNIRPNTTVVGRYEKFELSFDLARTYENPFDPYVVDVSAHFVQPDGQEVTVPGFIYQGFVRRMNRGAEELVPAGRRQWRIRFAPSQVGQHRYYVEVNDGEVVRSDEGTFTCVPSTNRGFVRISRTDPQYLEFDDGSFYYPIGHNIAAVQDVRARVMGVDVPATEGTYAYDRFLERMAGSGENFGRIWMSPWSFGLEWTEAYDIRYQGLGRYNLHNAWRLDHVLSRAEQAGVRIMLLFTGHGEIGDYESDFRGHDPQQLQGSPYWNRYGGPIGYPPAEFYASPEVLRLYKQKVRYIVARWGYSTAVMAWEILNEPDLPRFFQGPEVAKQSAEFVRQVASYIRQLDHAKHLITSGMFYFRQPWADFTLSLPELDLLTGHIFDNDLPAQLLSDSSYIQNRFKKPFLATEAGLTPFANDPEQTARMIRATLWASFMLPYPGAAAPWWWVLIDQKDLYSEFAALAAFAAGEDRRGQNMVPARAFVTDLGGGRALRILCLSNGSRAYCWIYDPAAFAGRMSGSHRANGAAVEIRNMSGETYVVELWDTAAGQMLSALTANASGGTLRFETMPFTTDIACKIYPPSAMAEDGAQAGTN